MLGEKMLGRLHDTLSTAGVPVVSVTLIADNTATIQLDPSATPSQVTQGGTILSAFDWSQSAQNAWAEGRHPDRKAIREAAVNAIADLDAFIAIAGPTNAQTLAIVRKLCQQNKQIIKRLIQID